MGAHYLNFHFKNLLYDDDFYFGVFSATDNDAFCEFEYNRNTGEIRIWNNSKPVGEILPIPIWWLERRLSQNGKLNQDEYKISY